MLKKLNSISGIIAKKGFKGFISQCLYEMDKQRSTRVRYLPQSVTVNIEGRCNFRCKYCMYRGDWADERYGNYWFTYEQIKPQIDLLRAFGLKYIHLCGTGEPFLNKDIFKMFEYIKKTGGATSILSNGSKVISNKIEQIIDVGLESFSTDLDTLDDKEFKELCGKDELKIVLSNIEKMANLRDKHGSKMKILINTIITKSSLPKLEGILQQCIDMGVDILSLNMLLTPLEDKGFLSKEKKLVDQREEVAEFMQLLKGKADKSDIRLNVSPYFDKNYDPNKLMCTRPWKTFMINIPNYDMPQEKWYGNTVVGCSSNKTHQYVLGNIFELGLQKIWNSEQMQALRQSLIDNTDPECKDVCLANRFC